LKPESLLIRADANSDIGTGHVMRCLALAQAWQDLAGEAAFAFAELPSALESRLMSEGFSVARMSLARGTPVDAESTIEIASKQGAGWVVIDGDHFNADFLRCAQSAGFHILLIDDFADREAFPADLILNPNLGASEEPYKRRGAVAALCLGESYVLLRREFTAWRGRRAFSERGGKVLVTLGGSDPGKLTIRIVEALAQLQSLEIVAVVGPGYTNGNELQHLVSAKVQVLLNPPDMCEVMEEADLAIIAAGGTLWELLYMQCGVLSYARNAVQANVVATLAAMNIVVDMGNTGALNGPALAAKVRELASSAALRERMANAGRRLIDGKGAQRVVETMKLLESRG
jgi:UDP-2,4-diacetamido-2,4,6-trideoxy-beta-L-altropyranose hydrolase